MEFTFEMFITLALVCFAIAGYASGKFPIDAVSISVLGLLFFIFEVFALEVTALAATGILLLFRGFGVILRVFGAELFLRVF